MNALFSPRSIRCLLLFALAAALLPLFTVSVQAGENPVVATSLQASLFMELVGNRARLVQVSVIFVAFGIWLMWWNK